MTPARTGSLNGFVPSLRDTVAKPARVQWVAKQKSSRKR